MKRRRFLTGVSAASILSYSGCLSNSIDEYPEGLTKSEITDLSLVLGEKSYYLSADSVTINMLTSGQNGTTEITARIDATTPAVFIKSRKKLPERIDSNVGDQIIEEFYTGESAYLRRFVESDPNDIDYRRYEYEFNKTQEFYSTYLTQLLENVIFNAHKLTENNRLVYTAKDSDFSESPSFTYEQINSIISQLTFLPDGKLIEFSMEKDSETENISQEILYTNYNQTSVSEPEWVIHAKNQ